jgi:hypothetical protein
MLATAALTGMLLLLPGVSSAQTISKPGRTPVLVELFTSEGCSSCPPADALLSKLDREQPVATADIIVLGEHVDYWDQLGWHDRFSSHQYTERQSRYSSRFNLEDVYTPQMVVDGTDQFVGNDAARARRAIAHSAASQSSKIALSVSTPMIDGHHVAATLSTAAQSTLPKGDLYAALIDPIDTTDVRSGENGGRHLQHVAVVRSLQRIGNLRDLAPGPVKFSLNAPDNSVPENMRLVVFAQSAGQGPILGVTAIATKQ